MPRIPEETVQEVLAATDIVELIGSYFPLKRVGTNYRALCPFHNEKTPSFNVNPARQSFHCFGCQAGGSAAGFIMEYENVDYPTAIRRLADRAGIIIPEAEFDPLADERSRRRTKLLALHKDAAEWFHYLLNKKEVAAPARDYLKARGISSEVAREWQLGYAPAANQLLKQWAADHQYPEDLLVEGGLLRRADDDNARPGETYPWFRDRLMFPVANEYGDTIAFSGRLLDPEARAAKYINSPESLIFTKGKTFYGLNKTKRDILRERSVIVCEGQVDLIACHAHGISNVVAPLGTAFTPQHAALLKRHDAEPILCFDSDQAGYKAAGRTFAELAKAGLIARVIDMPEGEDPDSLIKKNGADAFKALLDNARDFFDYQIHHESKNADMTSPTERLRVATTLATGAGLLEDKILQDSVIKKICATLVLPENEFRNLIVKEKRNERHYPPENQNTLTRPRGEPIQITNPNLLYITHALLTCADSRQWLSQNETTAFLEDIPQTAIIQKLWNASFDPENQSAVNTFTSSLPVEEESFLTGILANESPPADVETVKDCVAKLKKQALRRQLEQIISRIKEPGLPADTVSKLTKESLDLQRRLNDIARSLPEHD
ncbi:MAG: DNA primase [Verrucomicrobiota bacterium]